MNKNIKKPVVLCILDGWGYRPQKENNAIEMAKAPTWHRWIKEYPTTMIQTSGLIRIVTTPSCSTIC